MPNAPKLESDLQSAAVGADRTAMNAEAKVQPAEVGVEPPIRRRAEQPAKAGTERNRGVSDEAMIQRPNV